MRACATIAAVVAAALAVSACAGAGRSPDSAAAPPPGDPPRAMKADGDARGSKPCPPHRKVGEACRPALDVDDPRFWLALPLAAALIVTAPLWLPHVMFK